jgi:hypothetical protein
MGEVIKHALVEAPVAIEWEMPSDDAPALANTNDATGEQIAH